MLRHEIGELELHLLDEGRHTELHRWLGAHPSADGLGGVAFAVWAPRAAQVSVVGDWNFYDPATTPMSRALDGPVWTAFAPDARVGHRYKFAITDAAGTTVLHADPMAFETEVAPATASIIHLPTYRWGDDDWRRGRGEDRIGRPMSVYEVHVGSWRRDPAEPHRELTFLEITAELVDYVVDLGFTHVELLPVMGHPFAGSWGYQVTSYFAPSARWGSPEELKHLIDALHQAGVGVILDWVPAHFPKDDWALARFDGAALYEHADPRKGEHPDWGTYVFDFGRGGVRSFLLSNARYWLEEFHVDALRVDAVASMLYLDYSRGPGQWEPNEHGGREDLDAVSLLRELNELVHAPDIGGFCIAEESTAWPGVSRPVYDGGLGFTFKWDLGWMHDALGYFGRDPIHRKHHHDELTFGAHYADTEHFVLPLSHDEVVHGKGTLLGRMPGDRWQQLANLRSLFAWMWAHPGKQLLFMGGELGHEREWDHDRSLDWDLLADPRHAGIQAVVRDLNRTYVDRPALWSNDASPAAGFAWIHNDPDTNVAAFLRTGTDGEQLVCVANLSPMVRTPYALGMPAAGVWRELLNTDAATYGGSGVGNLGELTATTAGAHGQPASVEMVLPPLAVVWLAPA